jgi:hypothetical protein
MLRKSKASTIVKTSRCIGRTTICLLGLCLLLQTAAASSRPQAATLSIEGIVVSAGNDKPLAGVRLMISRLAINAQGDLRRVEVAPRAAQVVTNVLSDAEGNFVFANLEGGMYRVIATANGYVRQEYGQRSVAAGIGSAALIDLKPGQPLKNAVIRMTAGGADAQVIEISN